MFKNVFILGLCVSATSGCASSNMNGPFGYEGEFQQVAMVTGSTPGMSNQETSEAIDRAYLDGVLTSEQARKAHMQLDVKGHQTAEEIAVINRNRLAKRDQYETKKEDLDVIRDTAQTGSSVVSDIRDIKNTVHNIFN
jgi:hypothetical protein